MTTDSRQTRRHVLWIDVLKGLGITLVVYGHIGASTLPQRLVYVFHMPLFFFISGYLHKTQSNFANYARKKSIHLLIPYSFFLLATSIMQLIRAARHGLTIPRMEHDLFAVIWGGPHLKGVYGVLWFLTCLFLTQQLMNWLLVRYRLITVAAVVTVALVLSYVNSVYFPQASLPFSANAVAAAMPFFFAGYLFRGYDFAGWRVPVVGLLGFILSIWLLRRGVPISYNIRDGIYGVPFLSLALALCCILGCIQIARLLMRVPLLEKPFQRLGVMSMGIMLIHKELEELPGHAFLASKGVLVTFLFRLLVSYVAALILNHYSTTRALLLGSEKDFMAQFANRSLSISRTQNKQDEQEKNEAIHQITPSVPEPES
jgi:fucose 4-O-acetylase-like acetyltransferase